MCYIHCIIINIRVFTHITFTRYIRSDVHRTPANSCMAVVHDLPFHVRGTLILGLPTCKDMSLIKLNIINTTYTNIHTAPKTIQGNR